MSEEQNLVKGSKPYFDLAKNVAWVLGGLAAVMLAYFQATSDIKSLATSITNAESRINTKIETLEAAHKKQIVDLEAEIQVLFAQWNSWTDRVAPMDAVQSERINVQGDLIDKNAKKIERCCGK